MSFPLEKLIPKEKLTFYEDVAFCSVTFVVLLMTGLLALSLKDNPSQFTQGFVLGWMSILMLGSFFVMFVFMALVFINLISTEIKKRELIK